MKRIIGLTEAEVEVLKETLEYDIERLGDAYQDEKYDPEGRKQILFDQNVLCDIYNKVMGVEVI